jgi:hypothetical protein
VICQINFGKGLKKYCTFSYEIKYANLIVVPQKDKDENAGFVEYDMDEETGYRSPPLSSSSKPNRVLLE